MTERGHARLSDEYDEKTAEHIRRIVQEITDHYFPNGRQEKH